MRKQYEEYEKEGKLEELPLDNIFNPKFQPTPPPSENGMSIVMRPQAAVHMMKVEIPLEAIDELKWKIDRAKDLDAINGNTMTNPLYFNPNQHLEDFKQQVVFDDTNIIPFTQC